ncbi:MAG: SWIM zinc finger family protein [Micromonosporaceae bacterium]
MTARTFPAFGPRRGTVRGQSWWGRAWTKAMEETSLDQGRLQRGRTYARTGRVGAITVSPGRISAPVHGTGGEPYQTVVLVERLNDAEWHRFTEAVASRAGHIAALLDGEMPHDLVAAAAGAGVRLLPGVGDLEPECSCLDWGYPCKHAAAMCYQVAWLLDRDPFVLLMMRGRGEAQLLEALQLSGSGAGRGAGAGPDGEPGTRELAGVPAEDAYRRITGPLPEPPPPPGPAVGSQALPAPPDLPAAALPLLVSNAAVRARELLAGPARPLTAHQDEVRLVATFSDPAAPELARAVAAWRDGGVAGLETLETSWSPPPADLVRARTGLIADLERPVEIRQWRNRWTFPEYAMQLRYGQDRRWYPYRKRNDQWWSAGQPDRDPSAALADLLE